MRTVIVFFVLGVAASVCSAQWFQQNSGTTANLNALHFKTSTTGWAVGDSGTILKTTNGGQQWTSQTSGTTLHLYDVCFVDASTGWAVGGDYHEYPCHSDSVSVVLHTTDGGTSWQRQWAADTGRGRTLRGVYFVNANHGWAVGECGRIIRTANGGASWIQRSYVTDDPWNDVYFSDTNIGTIVGGEQRSSLGVMLEGTNDLCRNDTSFSVIKMTTDGGVTWTSPLSLGQYPYFARGVAHIAANTAIAVGVSWVSEGGDFYGNIVRTTDGGATWTNVAHIPDIWFNEVSFADPYNGWVVGGGMIYRTTDGGLTWTPQTSGTGWGRFGVCFTDVNNGWVVGNNGTILHTTNGGVTFADGERRDEVPKEPALSQNYPNPFNPSTTIHYALPHTSFVTVTVYNTLGQQVAQLVNEQRQAGYHDMVFRGDGLASGVYFYRIQTGGFVDVKKLILLR